MGFKYHVTYWAYSPSLNLNYIGSKSFNEFSEFEKYKTSAGNKNFRDSVLEKEILKFHNSRKEALKHEIELQKDFDVANNETFANTRIETINSISGLTGKQKELFILKVKESWTEEKKEKYSKMNSGENNPFYGKTHTQEVRQKVTEANNRRFAKPGAREAHGASRRGKKLHSEETKKRIGQAAKGRKHSRESVERRAKTQIDQTIYHWILKDKQGNILKEVECTANQLKKDYNLSQGNLYSLKKGSRRQTKGWHCNCLLNQKSQVH